MYSDCERAASSFSCASARSVLELSDEAAVSHLLLGLGVEVCGHWVDWWGGAVACTRHQIASANLVNNAEIMNKHRWAECSTVKETCLFPFPPFPLLSTHFFQSTSCISFWLSFLSPQKHFLSSLLPSLTKSNTILPSAVTFSPPFSFPLWPRQWQTL